MWVGKPQNTRRAGVIVFCFAISLTIWLNLPWLTLEVRKYYPLMSSFGHESQNTSVANTTLGVQRIFVVSSEDPSDPTSWRQKGLVAAANRTDLLLEIVSARNLQAWEVEEIDAQSKGSSQAWAAHNRALRQIIHENITIAIIMEDDVDWDINIRKLLAPSAQIAESTRTLTKSNRALDIASWPYGNQFDVFWLGHCGGRLMDSQPNITFLDESVLPASELAVWDKKPYNGAPDGYRGVRMKSGVVCSFAYAVTSSSAAKLLERRKNHEVAFDVEMNNACGGDLRCLTVQPELFHQQRMVGGRGSLIGEADEGKHGEMAGERPVTFNIRYSARCNAGHNNSDIVQCLPGSEDHQRFNGR